MTARQARADTGTGTHPHLLQVQVGGGELHVRHRLLGGASEGDALGAEAPLTHPGAFLKVLHMARLDEHSSNTINVTVGT